MIRADEGNAWFVTIGDIANADTTLDVRQASRPAAVDVLTQNNTTTKAGKKAAKLLLDGKATKGTALFEN